MDRDEGADEFAKMLFQVGVKGGTNALFDSLNSPAGVHKQTWTDIKQWYEHQSDDTRGFIQFIVREAAVLAVFGVVVNFDGASGYWLVGERPAEFSVAMRVYQNLDDAEAGTPQETIEVCPAEEGPDVHDLFLDLVDTSVPGESSG